MVADPARRRYILRTNLLMAAYVALNVAAIFGAFDRVGDIGHAVLALAVAAPVALQIWALLELMRESDEFVRGLLAKRFIMAAGLAMAVFSGWGFLESYDHAPHAPGWLIVPLFWIAFGGASIAVTDTH